MIVAFGYGLCAKCKIRRPLSTIRHGICTTCQRRAESELQTEAAIQAKVEAYLPSLYSDLRKLAKFGWFLAQRGEDEAPMKAWRWRDLPPWRKNRPRPLVYDGDEGEAHTTR